MYRYENWGGKGSNPTHKVTEGEVTLQTALSHHLASLRFTVKRRTRRKKASATDRITLCNNMRPGACYRQGRGFSNRCWSKEGLEQAADRVPNPTYSGIELLNLNPDVQIGCQLCFTSASSNAPDSPTDFMNSLFYSSPIHFKFDKLRKSRLYLLPVSPCPILVSKYHLSHWKVQ